MMVTESGNNNGVMMMNERLWYCSDCGNGDSCLVVVVEMKEG